MARSAKKGPYVDEKLLMRIEEMNKSGEALYLQSLLGILLQFTMERSLFPCLLLRIW